MKKTAFYVAGIVLLLTISFWGSTLLFKSILQEGASNQIDPVKNVAVEWKFTETANDDALNKLGLLHEAANKAICWDRWKHFDYDHFNWDFYKNKINDILAITESGYIKKDLENALALLDKAKVDHDPLALKLFHRITHDLDRIVVEHAQVDIWGVTHVGSHSNEVDKYLS